MAAEKPVMNCDDLAYWYLRMNGCLTVRNFILHPKSPKDSQLTDADVVAVRFPGFEFDTDADDAPFSDANQPILLVAEVKGGNQECSLNAPWRRSSECVAYVLRRFAPRVIENMAEVAEKWAGTGGYADSSLRCFFLCFGARPGDALRSLPNVEQKTWTDVLRFFHRRFQEHHRLKRNNDQWELVGNIVWRAWGDEAHGDYQEFCNIMTDQLGLPKIFA